MRDRCEVRCVGLDEDAIVWNGAYHVVAGPVLEGHDAAEGYVPTGVERCSRECEAAGVAVKNAAHSFPSRLANHCIGIVVRVARVDHYRQVEPLRELELQRECAALKIARRVVVVVVEAALSDGNRTRLQKLLQCGDVVARIERRGVVRVDSGGERDEARMRCRDPGRVTCLLDGCTDADDSFSARVAGARDYRVPVAAEGLIREVGVAVVEPFHAGAVTVRGYLRSIQSNTGPAM